MKAKEIKQLCKQAFEELVETVGAGKSETLVQYLRVMGRFHRYSLANQMLIRYQRNDAEHVAGFWTWKKLGRSVKKGAKGIAIMAPVLYKRKLAEMEVEDDEEKLPDLEYIQTFKPVYVFDVKDTEGKTLPQFAQVEGDPGVYLERLKSYICDQHIYLTYREDLGLTQGMSSGGQITLKAFQKPAEEFSTLVHELAHEMMHQTLETSQLSRKVRETEAEAVAFVVASGINLDVNTSSSDYIQLYNGKKEDLLVSLQRIQTTASDILGAITNDNSKAKVA